MTTTKLASWTTITNTLSPFDVALNFAGGFEADYDMDAVESDFRDAVAKVLPGSMFLSGEEFIADVSDDAISESWIETVREEIEMIDLGPMFEAHTVTA